MHDSQPNMHGVLHKPHMCPCMLCAVVCAELPPLQRRVAAALLAKRRQATVLPNVHPGASVLTVALGLLLLMMILWEWDTCRSGAGGMQQMHQGRGHGRTEL